MAAARGIFLCASILLVGSFPNVEADGPAPKIDERAVLKAHGKGAVYVAFSADGKLFASGGRKDAKVIVWDTASRKPLKTLEHGRILLHVAFCPKTGNLAVATTARSIRLRDEIPVVVIWDAIKGERIRTLEEAGGVLAFSPNGETLASRYRHWVVLWDTKTGKELGQLKEHTKEILGLAFSPDGKLLASCSKDGSVILWDVATRKKLAKWQPFSEDIHCVAFSLDGKLLAAGGNGYKRTPPGSPGWATSSIVFWDVRVGKEVPSKIIPRPGIPDNDPVKSLTFTRDGKLLVIGCPNYDLEIMEVATQDHWARLWGRWQARTIESVAVSPDGKTVLTGYGNGEIGIWEIPKERQKVDWEAIEERNERIKQEKKRKR